MPAFYITGIAISGLFICFILARKQLRRSDYLLILINLLLCSFLLLDWLVRERITASRFFLQTVIPYFIFPVYLVFALNVLQDKIHYHGRWMLFFVPCLLSTSFMAADIFWVNTYKEAALQMLYDYPPLVYHIVYKGNQLFFIGGLVWLLMRLQKYSHQIKDQFSFTDPIQLNWLRNTTWIFLLTTTVSILVFLIYNFSLLAINIPAAYSIVSLCIILVIFYTSFHGIRQYSIAEYYGKQTGEPALPNTQPEPGPSLPKEKYKSSSLTPDEQAAIYQRLLTLFSENLLYLEPNLQLQDVADQLQVTTHFLSQTINAQAEKPFYDFVNGYRVRHLQKLLADPSQKCFTILALGLESGFNSKASLNRVFKKETGLSPREYQLLHSPE